MNSGNWPMKIAHREVSPAHPPRVIAEIGINHGGSPEVAAAMVFLAALSGCECIKHQTHILEDEMTDEAQPIFPPNAYVSIWHVMEAGALSLEDGGAMRACTHSAGLIDISTSLSRTAANFRNTCDVPVFKIGSRLADIRARRPGSGEVAGYEFDKILGNRLIRVVESNTQLKWTNLD
jgi:sialic acid synthase SpsE